MCLEGGRVRVGEERTGSIDRGQVYEGRRFSEMRDEGEGGMLGEENEATRPQRQMLTSHEQDVNQNHRIPRSLRALQAERERRGCRAVALCA